MEVLTLAAELLGTRLRGLGCVLEGSGECY